LIEFNYNTLIQNFVYLNRESHAMVRQHAKAVELFALQLERNASVVMDQQKGLSILEHAW
jgi:hypothetical protein